MLKPWNPASQFSRQACSPGDSSDTHACSDLIEEYPTAVKEARAKLGLSQQDLAFKAKEKVTVIQKIEMGKMLPTMRLAKELEHILRIRLLVPRDELDIPAPPRRPSPSPGVTLGDVAVVRHKEGSDE